LETEITNQRYRLGISKDQASVLISSAYRRAVAKRGILIQIDDNLMKRIDSVAEWLTGQHKPGLLLYGGVGNGKSTLVLSVAEALVAIESAMKDWENDTSHWASASVQTRCPARSIVTTASPIINTATELSKMAGENEKAYAAIKACPFLILDDMGCEPSAIKIYGNELSPVSDTLYWRYDRQLPTMITTNMDKSGIREYYGPRIADRIEEMCDCIGFNQKSYRK